MRAARVGRLYKRLARLPPRGRVVVAAVPVRPRAAGGLEFLLVRTRSGERWTFPKGGCESGEAPAEAAAREALEEAGATGRVVGEPIGSYRYGDDRVTAFLLLVETAGEPHEPWREPAWFGLKTARSRLAAGRDGRVGQEMERVLVAAQRAAGRRALT
jgi:8-oxo-dGTP pyrophosphatase MutT (NUDIX family)